MFSISIHPSVKTSKFSCYFCWAGQNVHLYSHLKSSAVNQAKAQARLEVNISILKTASGICLKRLALQAIFEETRLQTLPFERARLLWRCWGSWHSFCLYHQAYAFSKGQWWGWWYYPDQIKHLCLMVHGYRSEKTRGDEPVWLRTALSWLITYPLKEWNYWRVAKKSSSSWNVVMTADVDGWSGREHYAASLILFTSRGEFQNTLGFLSAACPWYKCGTAASTMLKSSSQPLVPWGSLLNGLSDDIQSDIIRRSMSGTLKLHDHWS